MESSELRYALVKDGKVVNTVMAPVGWTDPDGLITYQSDVACIDWTTSDLGKTFVAPPAVAPAPATPEALTVTELLDYASAQQNTILAQVWSIDVGTTAAPLVLTTKLDTPGQNSMLKLAVWGQLNQSTGATEPYSNVDYSPATLSANQATLMAIKAGGVVSQSYATLNSLVPQINSGAITTAAQIASASWPDATVAR